MRNNSLLLMAFFLAIFLSGCATEMAYTVPPPPPAEVEVIPAAPFEGAIWVDGAWEWHPRHHRYYWRHGYWRR